MMIDPLHDPRIQIKDQERKRREAKGMYQAPNFMLWLGGGVLVLLVIVILGIVFHIF